MIGFFAVRPARLWPIVAVVIPLFFCIAYFHFVISRKIVIPALAVVSTCKTLEPGMRRLGNRYGFQFDVPVGIFRIVEGQQDMPPFAHGFEVTPKNGVSTLDISFGMQGLENMAPDPDLPFSKHVENRSILDDKGQPVGEDYWGYLNGGERWRRVRLFKGAAFAKYRFASGREAELFDRVISSVCFLAAPGS